MYRSSRPSAFGAFLLVTLLATPLLAQSDGSAPKTPEQCRSYAAQQANEEYLSQRTTNRETSPFARSPSGMRDPLQQSANQQAAIDRTSREQQIYDDCVAKLGKQ